MPNELPDRVVPRALAVLPKHPRPADPARIETVLAEVGLPGCPAYADLLAHSNGLEFGGSMIFGVGGDRSRVDPLTEWLGRFDALIPIGFGAGAIGWSPTEQSWVEIATYDHSLGRRFPDDAAALHEVFCQDLAGYVPRPPRRIVPPLPELLADRPGTREPGPAATVRRAGAVFLKRTGTGSAGLKELWQLSDGFDDGTVSVLGAADFVAAEQPDPTEATGWATVVGRVADRLICYDRREEQWQVVPADFGPCSAADRFASFGDLLTAVVDPAAVRTVDLDPTQLARAAEQGKAALNAWLDERPADFLRPPAATRTRNRALKAFTERTSIPAPADLAGFLERGDGFDHDGLKLYGATQQLREQDDLPEHLYAVGSLDDRILVFDAVAGAWDLLDAGGLDRDSDADRHPSFGSLVVAAATGN